MRLVELTQNRVKESVLLEYEEEKANGTLESVTFDQMLAEIDEVLEEMEENEDSESNEGV